MLFSVEQAFVGRDEKGAPLKTPAWEAMFELDGRHPYEHPCYGQLTAVKKGIC